TAHTQVIAEDLANIVASGGEMADEIASNLGTTTDEIANSLSQDVSNQSIAAQAIAANTNVAIGQMAEAVGQLFDTLGSAISNFKVDVSFGIKSISWSDLNLGKLGSLPVPKLNFGLEASGESLAQIGSALSSFGKNIASSLAPQMIEIPDFSTKGTSANKHNSNASSNNTRPNSLRNSQGGSRGNGSSTPITQAGTAVKDTSQEIVDAINAQIDALEREKKAAQESYQAQIDDLDDLIKEKQKQIDAINDEADAIKEASEARKRDIDLQKAQYDVARAENQRVKLIYSQGQGLQYSTDTTEIRDKREKVMEIQEDLEIAKLKKQADLIQDEIDALEEKKDLIKEAMEESNKYYEGLIEDLQETAREAQKTAQEMERTATAASRVRSLQSGGTGFTSARETGDGALQGDGNQQTDLNGSIQGIADALGEIPAVQETLYSLSDAFFSLGEAIQSVSDALGIGEESTVSKVVEALNAIGTASLSGEEDGIIAQFEHLKEAVNAVSAAISSGGSKGEPGAPKKLGKEDGSAGSLTSAITELQETTEEALGSGESEEGSGKSGEGTGVIGKFVALKAAVDHVTSAIGPGEEGENEEGESNSLIGALHAQDATATEVLPKEKVLFENLHDSITMCVSALNEMIAALQEIQSLGGPAGISSSPSKAILGQALAKGYNGLPRTMKNALRSEYGQPELTVYPNGKTELTTQPVMSDLPKGTVVYNARQTDAILRGKTKAVPLSQGMVLPSGQMVVPYVPEKSALPLSSLSLIPSAPEIRRDPMRMASAVQQVSVRNTQPVVHNTVHMSLPNVTNNSGVEYIEKELGHLSLRALQEPLKRY
ncbi:MAG: hypothetical protein HFI32_07320, partial [Lachnospiraceae bacterium]|nr:hypothetical protein [Lachnospiraceae bacterium]